MTTEPANPDVGHLSQMLLWLDEERRRDRSELARMQAAIEETSTLLRELTTRTEEIESLARAHRIMLARIPDLDEQVRNAFEPLGTILDWQAEHERQLKRQEQMRVIEAERDRKTLAELQDQLTDARRDIDAGSGRLQLLTDDVRRAAAAIPPVGQRVDEAVKAVETVQNRLHLLDEWRRRDASEIAALGQRVEAVVAEAAKLAQWQQLAELRWTRQLSEWQVQMEEFRRALGDAVRTAGQVAHEIDPLKDAIEQVRRALGEERQKREGFEGRLAALGLALDAEIEKRKEFETRVDSLRQQHQRNADHIVAVEREVALGKDADRELADGVTRVAARAEELALWTGRIESAARISDERIDAGQLRVQEVDRAQTVRIDGVIIELREHVRRLEARLAELEEREQLQKRRQIAELEQQIREVRGRFGSADGAAAPAP